MTLQGIDTNKGPIYSLLPLEDFKAILGIDDREGKIARYCLVTATYTIEQYCKRRLIRKKHFESLEYIGDLFIPLREYPVTKVLVAYAVANNNGIVTRAVITGKKYISLKKQNCGDGWQLEIYRTK